uniref:Macrophage-expressed gene 1 protein n=1 Tax=Anolis carolinensis TaxID=28377 RepID=G1KFN1_ANOCA|nr:PREDICTED: macrophage-expressed gene 1 protein [Anolis carolinensis]|eukprot:XP_003215051.1 PREDICTED: macrophage-expressed gene 1 protein [Anolis carolinensis]
MSHFMDIFRSLVFIFWTSWALESHPVQPSSASGFQECRQTLGRPALEVLPGGGWDNLQNRAMGRVIHLNYSLCRTTEDGAYLIPNDVFTIPLKETYLELNSEIIESWMDYQSATSASINAELSTSFINGKFSSDFRWMKTHQVKDQTVTTRVQVRNRMYTVKFDPAARFDEGFQQQLVAIASHLENNQTRAADYLAEILVLNYGTHVITGVDAGASLIQEDQVRSTFVKDSKFMRSSITAAAGVSFHKVVNFQSSLSVGIDDSFIKQYEANRTNSRVESIGGLPFYPGITLKTWQESIPNRLVAIDRFGLPLEFFITPEKLPGLPNPIVKRLSKTVASAITRYYTFNTYPGCTNAASPNFNFYANMDDGTCEGTGNNFTFGGAYQVCAQLEGPDAATLCAGLAQRNPLTGAYSCPTGYISIQLGSQELEEGYNHWDCHNDCFVWKLFCKRVCKDIFTLSKVQFSTYWCAATGIVPKNSGFLFGGLFSTKNNNPMTNAQSCPSMYYQLKLFDQLKVCVSRDERGQRYSVPFGGFFSCQVGNPLVGFHNGTDNDPYPKRCPTGFSQHLALISDGCEVDYCVPAGRFTEGSLPQARLPPFNRKPTINLIDTDTILVMNSNSGQTWIKDSQTHLWKIGNPDEVYHSMKKSMTTGESLSNGEVAGVALIATVGLVSLISLVICGCRRYKKKGYHEIGEEESAMISSSPDGLRNETVDMPQQQESPIV